MAYPYVQEQPGIASRTQVIWYPAALAVITLLGLLLRAIGVGRYPGLIYDEYYYVPAADVLLRREPPVLVKNMVPGIDPNLLSHPPFAKELIALAIFIFGNHPWVWRLPGVVLGSAVPIMAAGIAWELFGNRRAAVAAAVLAAMDGLLLAMARVALPDSPAVPLVVLALWLLLRITGRLNRQETVNWGSWLLLGLVLGLSLGSEWIGGQAVLVAWIWFLIAGPRVRRAVSRWLSATTVVPFFVYYATYFYSWPRGFLEPWLPKNPFIAFFKLQWLMLKDMWNLRFFHPWTASAWTWLGIPRPTALLLTVETHRAIRLMAFPDPVIVWLGLLSLAAGGVWVIRRRIDLRPAWIFLTLWLVCFYGTWLLTSRSKFLYYFTTASVGLDIAAGAGFVLLWEAARRIRLRRLLRAVGAVLGASGVLSAFYLLPLWVGMATPRPLYHAVWWPDNWNPRVNTAVAASTQSFSLTLHPSVRTVPGWTGLNPPSAAQALPSTWTVFRGQTGHNSVYAGAFTLKKSYAISLSNTALVEAPAVSGTTAYVGTNNSQLYAVNLLTGSVKWAVGLPNMVMTTPLLDQGLVVVGLGNNVFRSYNQSQGWIRGTGVNGLMAFNAQTGHEAWFYQTIGEDMATPVIDNGVVYDVTGGGRLVAVSLTSGKLLWSLRLKGFDSMSSPIVMGGELYVATNLYLSAYPAARSTVWAVNLTTHEVTWSRNIPVKSGLSDSSIAASGSHLYVGGVPWIGNQGQSTELANKLFALNRRNGKILWTHWLGSGTLKGLDQEEVGIPLAVGQTVYQGSPVSDRVVALDASTGRVLWRRHLPTGVTANPVLLDNRILVAGMNGTLYLLSPSSGRILSKDPLSFGRIGPAAPLIVSNALLQSTITGQLVVQKLGH